MGLHESPLMFDFEAVSSENLKFMPMSVRFNLDAFNVLNQPGLPLPSGEGIISLRTSAQAARTLQYTMRLTW